MLSGVNQSKLKEILFRQEEYTYMCMVVNN